jgi:hypothetical protein
VIYPARGLLKWWLERTRWAGVAIPPFGAWIEPAHLNNERLVKHETRHLEQAQEVGVLKWYVLYAWYTLRHGYWNNPFEVDAREAEGT